MSPAYLAQCWELWKKEKKKTVSVLKKFTICLRIPESYLYKVPILTWTFCLLKGEEKGIFV